MQYAISNIEEMEANGMEYGGDGNELSSSTSSSWRPAVSASKIWREDADADTDDAATMTCRFGHVGTTFADSSTFPVCRNS